MPLRLEQIRRSRKMSQLQLAKKSGVSRTYISELESGKYNPSKTLCKLAKALDCSLDDLVNCN